MAALLDPSFSVTRPAHLLDVLRQGCRSITRQRVQDYATWPQQEPAIPSWRASIVVWMQRLGTQFRFSPECIEVAVNYFDRLMSAVYVDRHQLQKAALACILIATKQHETCALSMDIVSKVMPSITTVQELTKMELDVLSALHWDINAFTATQFVQCVTSLITNSTISTVVRGTAEHLLQAGSMKRYELIRYTSCEHGIAAVAAACSVHNFQYEGLVDSLKAVDIPVELHASLLDWFVRFHSEEAHQAELHRERCYSPVANLSGLTVRAPAYSPAPSTLTATPVRTEESRSPDFNDSSSIAGNSRFSDFRAQSAEGGRRSTCSLGARPSAVRERAYTEFPRRSGLLPCLPARSGACLDSEDVEEDMVEAMGGSAVRGVPAPVALRGMGFGHGQRHEAFAGSCMGPGAVEARPRPDDMLCPGPRVAVQPLSSLIDEPVAHAPGLCGRAGAGGTLEDSFDTVKGEEVIVGPTFACAEMRNPACADEDERMVRSGRLVVQRDNGAW